MFVMIKIRQKQCPLQIAQRLTGKSADRYSFFIKLYLPIFVTLELVQYSMVEMINFIHCIGRGVTKIIPYLIP